MKAMFPFLTNRLKCSRRVVTFLLLSCVMFTFIFFSFPLRREYMKYLNISNSSPVIVRYAADTRKILYWSRHHATLANIGYVANHFNITMDDIKPQKFQDYGISENDANDLIKTNLIPVLCKNYPVIIACDTIPDSRPFLQHDGCEATIILEITNRFDFGLWAPKNGRKAFLRLLKKRAYETTPDGRPRLLLLSNNPWDLYYTRKEIGLKNIDIPIIRPLGIDPVPSNEAASHDPSTKNIICTTSNNYDDKIDKELKEKNIPIKRLSYHYGGSKALARYKANVVIPYQVSVMKMLENLSDGVITLLPSAKFFKQLVIEWDIGWVKPVVELSNWTDYVEFYCPDFKDFFYHFDSWEHLKQLTEREGPIENDDRVERGRVAAKKMREEGLEAWRKLFVRAALLESAA